MRKFILIYLILSGCAKDPREIPGFLYQYQDKQSPHSIIVDGTSYYLAESWAENKLVLWESVPEQTNQFFISNVLSVKHGGKPIMNRRNRE